MIAKVLICIGLVLIYIFCIPVRIAVNKLYLTVYYGAVDLVVYVLHKRWREAPVGKINIYTGLFGKGKTLSAVHYATSYYQRYNNKLIYDEKLQKWKKQYVNVVSNVVLKIPYTKFESMQQIVDIAKQKKQYDEENECRLVSLVLGDEFSVQMNSRNFKSNLPAPVLNSILTMRHADMLLIATSQRFQHCDALFRQVTQNVIECKKIWRLQVQNTFDAWELEQQGSMLKVKPLKRGGFFVTNKDYNAYDTSAVVDNLIKDYESGALMTEEQILALRGEFPYENEVAVDTLNYRSRRLLHRRRR